MTGSRDPIRQYLEDMARYQRRRTLIYLAATFAIAVILWAMIATAILALT